MLLGLTHQYFLKQITVHQEIHFIFGFRNVFGSENSPLGGNVGYVVLLSRTVMPQFLVELISALLVHLS